MRGVERRGDLADQHDGRPGLEPPLPPEQRPELLPLYEADGEKQVSARLPRLVEARSDA